MASETTTPALPGPLRVASTDAVEVAAYPFGGAGRPMLGAHATGFCAATLAPMAVHLPDTVSVTLFDERGHGASGRPASGSYDWHGFADDALAVVDALGLDRPLGFGHSCGGAALVLAELARPGTFAGLYLYEPVIPPVEQPAPGASPDNPLSAGARRRRPWFASRAEALDNFSTKPPLGNLDPAALAAYVEHGLRPAPGGGVELCCDRSDEAAVYAAAWAHDAFPRLAGVHCPVTVAYGGRTDSFDAAWLAPVVARLPRAELVVLDHLGHFGPLQDPGAVARSLQRSLAWTAGLPAG